MLYDGAIRFLSQSAVAMETGTARRHQPDEPGARAIIDLLKLTLSWIRARFRALRAIYVSCSGTWPRRLWTRS